MRSTFYSCIVDPVGNCVSLRAGFREAERRVSRMYCRSLDHGRREIRGRLENNVQNTPQLASDNSVREQLKQVSTRILKKILEGQSEHVSAAGTLLANYLRDIVI